MTVNPLEFIEPIGAVRKHPLANCEDCTLYHGKFVPSKFPTGNSNGLAFIGESPGKREKAKGEPFVGQSGQVLDAVLSEHGILRSESLLTNAALCNYTDEEKSVLPRAIECCRPRLLSELETANTHTAVTLGNAASKSLLDTKTGITRLRGGPPKVSDYAPTIKVVPTFHPAATLRNQANFPLLVSDIGKCSIDQASQSALWIEPIVHVINDAHTAVKTLRESKITDPLVIDTESAWEKDVSFTRNTNILCMGIGSTSQMHGNVVIVIGKPAITNYLVQREICNLIAKVGMVAQNAKYDYHVLNALNEKKFNLRVAYDTMLASYSLHEVPGVHGLKYMAHEYLGTPHYEEDIKEFLVAPKDPPEVRAAALDYLRDVLGEGEVELRTHVLEIGPTDVSEAALKRAAKELHVTEFKDKDALFRPGQIRWAIDPTKTVLLATPEADGSFASVPPELLHKYNAYDVQATRQLYFYFRKKQQDQGLTRFNAHLVRMSNTLARIESAGLTVDMEYNEKLQTQFQADIDRLQGPFTFNPRSIPQLKNHFLEEFGIEIESTGEEKIKELVAIPNIPEKVVQFCDDLLGLRKVTKLKSTYVDAIRKKALTNGGKIFPTFVINQATTGRLASKNPNVQNMPRLYDIKRQFVAAPGNVFIHADYSQLELRVITWLAKDENMRALFNDPTRDVFDELTKAVHGLTDEEFNAIDKTLLGEMRVAIKSFAYGILFSRSAEGIAMDPDMDISIHEARRQMNLFKKQIPGIMNYQDEIKQMIHDGKDLVNPFGRRRRFHLITKQNVAELERQAVSFMPQGTASDICITAAGKMVDMGYIPSNIIHDAILLECRIEDLYDTARLLIKTMVDTAEEICESYVSFDVDATFGDTWQDAAKKNKEKSNVIRLEAA